MPPLTMFDRNTSQYSMATSGVGVPTSKSAGRWPTVAAVNMSAELTRKETILNTESPIVHIKTKREHKKNKKYV